MMEGYFPGACVDILANEVTKNSLGSIISLTWILLLHRLGEWYQIITNHVVGTYL
jgi:hypothetical protein